MNAVTPLPEYHGCSLSEVHGRAALARIAVHGVLVVLTSTVGGPPANVARGIGRKT